MLRLADRYVGAQTEMEPKLIDRSRAILGSLLLAGALGGASESAVAIAALPTSGVCGFAVSIQYPFVYIYGSSPGPGWGMNVLGTLDFGASKISANFVLQNPIGPGTTESQVQVTAPFTAAAGPIAGSTTISFTPSGGTPLTFNLLAVNGGNTLLMQGFNPTAGSQDGGAAGVCQF